MRRRTFLAGAAAAGVLSGAKAPGADWSEDIRILRRAYEALHPGLYRYAGPSQIAARFAKLERKFADGPTLPQAYLALSKVLASIRCGHTYANFYNQSDAVAEALFSARTRLPFRFRWAGGTMTVTDNFSGDARLARGTRILSVDGVKTSRILRDLLPYVRADGGNDAKRQALLEVQGGEGFETFDVFHALKFGPFGERARVTAIAPGDRKTMTFDVALATLAERRAQIVDADGGSNPLGWSLTWPKERVALLFMPNWAAYQVKWNWQGFLDDAFAELDAKKATGLIVDIRRNEGGNDCGDEVIARLVDAPVEFDSYRRLVRYQKTPADLDPHLDTWDPSFKTLGEGAVRFDDRFFELKNDDGVRTVTPKGPRFRGRVAVLISPTNSSATFQFASAMRRHRLATLIGEPTGGNQRGINGGAYFFLRLPKSGLEADLPLIGYFPDTEKLDTGLAPDVLAPWTAAAIASGYPALSAALSSLAA